VAYCTRPLPSTTIRWSPPPSALRMLTTNSRCESVPGHNATHHTHAGQCSLLHPKPML
jgi:hypothetical protein